MATVAKQQSARAWEYPRTLISFPSNENETDKPRFQDAVRRTKSPRMWFHFPFPYKVVHSALAIVVRNCVKTMPRTMHSLSSPSSFFSRFCAPSFDPIQVYTSSANRCLAVYLPGSLPRRLITLLRLAYLLVDVRKGKKENVRNISAETLLHQI